MTSVYRISNLPYKDDLSGTGAKLYGSRWNSIGTPMLYLAGSISLAWLEMLVHLQYQDKSTDFALLYVNLPPDAAIQELQAAKLKQHWQQDIGYTRFIGDEFIRSKQKLALKVPSAVVEEEANYLVNPLHPAFKKVGIVKSKIFQFDHRLFK
jgi:RES domain-containing protein